MQTDMDNPCLTCGACCAAFRVSFYWAESDDAREDGVPAALTEKISPYRLAMRGTNQPSPRCAALEGEVGRDVRCMIYPHRSSVCREVKPSWQEGQADEKCDNARRLCGLTVLEPKIVHK